MRQSNTNEYNLKMGDDVKYVGPDRCINKKYKFKIIRLEEFLVTIRHPRYRTQFWRVTYRELKPAIDVVKGVDYAEFG